MRGSYRSILMSTGLSLGLLGFAAGCGQSPSSASGTSFGGSVHTTAPSNTSQTSPSPSQPASTTPASSTQSVSFQTPAPPQAGVYSEMTIRVTKVTPEGQDTVNGQRLDAYTLTVSVNNPTSAMIPLSLNDFTVEPLRATTYSYSYNDVKTSWLTAGNSLFPLPLKASTPSAVIRYVEPGSSIQGQITVMVPPSSSYQVRWGDSTHIAATFASP